MSLKDGVVVFFDKDIVNSVQMTNTIITETSPNLNTSTPCFTLDFTHSFNNLSSLLRLT